MLKNIKIIFAVLLLNSSAFAGDNTQVVSIPDGSIITFDQPVVIEPNLGSVVLFKFVAPLIDPTNPRVSKFYDVEYVCGIVRKVSNERLVFSSARYTLKNNPSRGKTIKYENKVQVILDLYSENEDGSLAEKNRPYLQCRKSTGLTDVNAMGPMDFTIEELNKLAKGIFNIELNNATVVEF